MMDVRTAHARPASFFRFAVDLDSASFGRDDRIIHGKEAVSPQSATMAVSDKGGAGCAD